MQYIQGDLMKAPEPMIVHGCNARRKMGKGVAKLIRDQYPYAYDAYMVGSQTLGDVIIAEGPKIIANAITQDGYRQTYVDDQVRYADYDAIAKAFVTINDYCVENQITEIAIPKIGAGLAGGDWDIIAEIIEAATPDVSVKVYWI